MKTGMRIDHVGWDDTVNNVLPDLGTDLFGRGERLAAQIISLDAGDQLVVELDQQPLP